MKTINNKTKKPLSIPLPRGKKLHLGPGKTGQIADNASEFPAVKKLIEAGEIEIVAEGAEAAEMASGNTPGKGWMPGHGSTSASRRSGDR